MLESIPLEGGNKTCFLSDFLTDRIRPNGYHETLAERSCTIPSELKFLSGYNKPESHKHMQKEAGRKFNTNTHHGTLCWSAEPNKNALYEIRCVDRSACSCPNISNKYATTMHPTWNTNVQRETVTTRPNEQLFLLVMLIILRHLADVFKFWSPSSQ